MGLDAVELVMSVEETFGIEIADREVGTIRTAGDLHRCVLRKLGVSEDEPRAAEAWDRLVAIFADEFGVPPETVVPEADIVKDLGID